MFDLLEATIDQLHRAMLAGEITSARLVDLYTSRIKAYDQSGPGLNAVQCLNPMARSQAEALDAQLQGGAALRPLHGIPILVKDQVETTDMPTSYGSAVFKGYRSGRDATVIRKLEAAGAIILGKTNMGEIAQSYAGSAYGVCRNPYDPARNPSGSSSGTGAGLAANFATIGLGEDSGGSIRGPAAVNNLVGLRPTVPLVSRFGMMPIVPTRDTLGPICRTVRDAAILLDVLAGYDPGDPITAASVGRIPETYTSFLLPDALAGIRVGVIRQVLARDTDPEADDYRQLHAVLEQAFRDLATAGAEVIDPVELPPMLELITKASGNYETEAALDAYLASLPDPPVKTLQELILSQAVIPSRRARLMDCVGRTTNDLGYLRELHARESLRQALLTAMAEFRLDAVVYATLDHPAEPIPEDVLTRRTNPSQRGNNRFLAAMVGFPAMSVPAGFTEEGVPVGLEILGRPFTEGTLLRIAYGHEQATHHRRPPSTTPALPKETLRPH